MEVEVEVDNECSSNKLPVNRSSFSAHNMPLRLKKEKDQPIQKRAKDMSAVMNTYFTRTKSNPSLSSPIQIKADGTLSQTVILPLMKSSTSPESPSQTGPTKRNKSPSTIDSPKKKVKIDESEKENTDDNDDRKRLSLLKKKFNIIRKIIVGDIEKDSDLLTSKDELSRIIRHELKNIKNSIVQLTTTRIERLSKFESKTEHRENERTKLSSLEQENKRLKDEFNLLEQQYLNAMEENEKEIQNISSPDLKESKKQKSSSDPKESKKRKNNRRVSLENEKEILRKRIDALEETVDLLTNENWNLLKRCEILEHRIDIESKKESDQLDTSKLLQVIGSLEIKLEQKKEDIKFEKEKVSHLETANAHLWVTTKELEKQTEDWNQSTQEVHDDLIKNDDHVMSEDLIQCINGPDSIKKLEKHLVKTFIALKKARGINCTESEAFQTLSQCKKKKTHQTPTIP